MPSQLPHYLRFTRALAFVGGVGATALVAGSCGTSSSAPPATTSPPVDSGRDTSIDDDTYPAFEIGNPDVGVLPEAAFDVPETEDGGEIRTCRCAGEDAANPDLADAGLAECASYAEAVYNHCFGVPGPLPPPELPTRARRKSPRRSRRSRRR